MKNMLITAWLGAMYVGNIIYKDISSTEEEVDKKRICYCLFYIFHAFDFHYTNFEKRKNDSIYVSSCVFIEYRWIHACIIVIHGKKVAQM